MARKMYFASGNKKQSIDWFTGKIKDASRVFSGAFYRRAMLNRVEALRKSTYIGKMYFFYYDPKLKDKLPIYDRFPLVFPIEQYSDGFLGLNLHYLTTDERDELLGKLMEYSNGKGINPRTTLALSYDLIKNVSKLAALGRPCIKRYLFSQVRSPFVEVIPSEWKNAIDLPVELFVGKR